MTDIPENIPPPEGTRAAQKRETRQKILEAALQEFSEKGFDSASVRDIASLAGVNHGLIKYHFQGKEALWKAAVDFLFERLDEEMTEPDSVTSLPRPERIRLWIHRYVRYCAQHPEHARIMVHESIRDSDRLKWAADKHVRQRHEILLNSLPVTLDMERYPDFDIPTLVYLVNAATQAPFTLAAEIRHLYGTEVNRDAFVESYADGIYDLFFKPYLAPPKPKKTR